MDLFTSIAQHLGVLRGMLGDVTADTLASATAGLPDDAVVAMLAEATAIVKAADAVRTVAAGVAAARSTREAGHDGLAQQRGHRSPVSLVQEITGTSKADATRHVRLGESMLHALPGSGPELLPGADPAPGVDPWDAPLNAALLSGTITTGQGDAIRRNLGEPPTDGTGTVSPATVEAWRLAVGALIAEAASRSVEELGQTARILRDRLDPDGAERRYLARFEARSLRTWTDADGVHHGRVVFDDRGYAWIRSIIDAALRPRTGGPRFVDPDQNARADVLVADPRSNEQLAYDLILDLLGAGAVTDAKAVFGAKLPGVRVVTIVSTGAGAAGGYVEETGEPVPATFIAQHTCNSGTKTCTLDTAGNPLNLGREARLYTPTQKIALALRDGGCRIPGCDRPPHMTEAHHIDEFAKGGRTDIDRGILLCRFHHLNLHDNGWNITRAGLGDFILHRPEKKPVVLPPRLARTVAWAGIDPPPKRFRTAA